MSARMSVSSPEDWTLRVAIDIFFPLFGLNEKQLQISAQMIEAAGGNIRVVLGLREDESALYDGLGVEREALGAPLRIDTVLAQRVGNVRFKHGGVLADMLVAGFSDDRMRLV